MYSCFNKQLSEREKNLFAVLIALSLLIIDQLSKFFVTQYISPLMYGPYYYPYGGLGVFKSFLGIEFSINYMTNNGAAWGLLGQYQIPLIIVRLFLIIGSIIYLIYYNKYPSWKIPLLLVIAGATGNVIDFFTYGHVVDMFHFVFWGFDFPVFNVADSSIFIGVCCLLYLSWNEDFMKKKQDRQDRFRRQDYK